MCCVCYLCGICGCVVCVVYMGYDWDVYGICGIYVGLWGMYVGCKWCVSGIYVVCMICVWVHL